MKVKQKSNYAILCLVFFIGIIIGYSNNFSKTKRFHRTHAPIGIELDLQLTYLEDSIHYILMISHLTICSWLYVFPEIKIF